MENLKIAFITHATGIGGATISSTTVIQYLVENSLLKPENCIIIHEKQDLPSNYHNDVYFNLKKSIKFYECKLPSSYVIKGTPKLFTFKLLCYKKTFEALFWSLCTRMVRMPFLPRFRI